MKFVNKIGFVLLSWLFKYSSYGKTLLSRILKDLKINPTSSIGQPSNLHVVCKRLKKDISLLFSSKKSENFFNIGLTKFYIDNPVRTFQVRYEDNCINILYAIALFQTMKRAGSACQIAILVQPIFWNMSILSFLFVTDCFALWSLRLKRTTSPEYRRRTSLWSKTFFVVHHKILLDIKNSIFKFVFAAIRFLGQLLCDFRRPSF